MQSRKLREKPNRSELRSAMAGAGLKHEHAHDILHGCRRVDFFEVHAENYMGAGGPPHRFLEHIRRDYPLSIHGIGASIGGSERLDKNHLHRLKRLIEMYRPELFSEHLAWSTHEGAFFNDLLPLPYNENTLAIVVDHIDELQNAIGMRLLLENPSHYLPFGSSTMGETEFLRAVAKRTGCGLLLDVNNVHVSAINCGFDASAYIAAFPAEFVGEMHLAGHAEDTDAAGAPLLIDDHGRAVDDKVWQLFRLALVHTGPVPALIERDNYVPSFAALAVEVARARAVLSEFVKPGLLAA
jgi:uncharacterized protein